MSLGGWVDKASNCWCPHAPILWYWSKYATYPDASDHSRKVSDGRSVGGRISLLSSMDNATIGSVACCCKNCNCGWHMTSPTGNNTPDWIPIAYNNQKGGWQSRWNGYTFQFWNGSMQCRGESKGIWYLVLIFQHNFQSTTNANIFWYNNHWIFIPIKKKQF